MFYCILICKKKFSKYKFKIKPQKMLISSRGVKYKIHKAKNIAMHHIGQWSVLYSSLEKADTRIFVPLLAVSQSVSQNTIFEKKNTILLLQTMYEVLLCTCWICWICQSSFTDFFKSLNGFLEIDTWIYLRSSCMDFLKLIHGFL